jgi:glycolate oxidase FAD binding subunit
VELAAFQRERVKDEKRPPPDYCRIPSTETPALFRRLIAESKVVPNRSNCRVPMSPADVLCLKNSFVPADPAVLADAVRAAYEASTPLYLIGGGTSLAYGLPAKEPGEGLSLAGLNRVIDYPARDMTVTVEAGVTMQTLADLLATERQRLPIDVPQADQATIGGVVATGWNGPRRYGQGSVRDHVIGISAIDGRGMPFHGGGRVVKNVAGYDFCKLLTGSLGTLGVITEVTLKLKPQPEQQALLACSAADGPAAERLLAALVQSAATPTAVELLAGPEWEREPAFGALEHPGPGSLFLVVSLEGTAAEVEYMIRQLSAEWRALGVEVPLVLGESARTWRRIVEFSADSAAPLVLKASVVPSGVLPLVQAARQVDPAASILAHAGNGTVFIKFAQFPAQGLSRTLVSQLQPAAAAQRGHLVVLSNPSGAEMTHQSMWGAIDAPLDLMGAIKRKFDPKDILNRGRFVYVGASG